MRIILYLSTFLIIVSCSPDVKREISRGYLEDFVSDTFVFHRDDQTGFLGIRGSIHQDGKEYIYAFWNNKFHFFDPITGKTTHSFEIPREGPGSIRGGFPQTVRAFDENLLVVYGYLGDINLQRGDSIFRSFQLDKDALGIQHQNAMSSFKQKITQVSPTIFELSNDPFDLMSFSDRTRGFDTETFGAWIAQFDDQGNWICISDFKGPFDKSYGETLEVGDLMRITENGVSWSLFPFSDSLYQTENCKVTRVLNLESSTPIKYYPSKEVSVGSKRTWVRPDDAGANLYLIQDPVTGVKVRTALLEQKRDDNADLDPRSRIYSDETLFLLLLYDKEWRLLAELKMDYKVGTRFENIFVSNGSLFINKPEQKSEDEYEFHKIDLSQFID